MSIIEGGFSEGKHISGGEKGEGVSFENLDFTKINFKLKGHKDFGVSIDSIYTGEQSFLYMDQQSNIQKEFILNVVCHEVQDKFTREESNRSYSFAITDGDGCRVLGMELRIDRHECFTNKKKQNQVLNKSGFGGACYDKMIDFIGYVSEKNDLDFVHSAFKVSKLPLNKWNKVFGTILKGKGYEPVAFEKDVDDELLPVEWQKHYKGKNKN